MEVAVEVKVLVEVTVGVEVEVKVDMPGLKGPEVERLYAEGRAWLEGSATDGRPR